MRPRTSARAGRCGARGAARADVKNFDQLVEAVVLDVDRVPAKAVVAK
ncbi:MAG: hypothetical protein WBA53_04105 [Burkholderiaceae bacterium]